MIRSYQGRVRADLRRRRRLAETIYALLDRSTGGLKRFLRAARDETRTAPTQPGAVWVCWPHPHPARRLTVGRLLTVRGRVYPDALASIGLCHGRRAVDPDGLWYDSLMSGDAPGAAPGAEELAALARLLRGMIGARRAGELVLCHAGAAHPRRTPIPAAVGTA